MVTHSRKAFGNKVAPGVMHWGFGVTAITIMAAAAGSVSYADDLRGVLTIAGRGPELPVIEALAKTFEKSHLGTAIELKWNKNYHLSDMVREGEADLAVTGQSEPGMTATTVAWDGLAVVVNFSNPIKEVKKSDVAALFSGKIRNWSELDENAAGKVRLVVRPDDQNLNHGFEESLGIVGNVPRDSERARSDQKLLSRVVGQLDAVGYLSLHAASEAVKYGTSVRILIVDGVDPGAPTIRSGAYQLKRPVIFLTKEQASPLAQAFVQFVLSPTGRQIIERTYVFPSQ